jgi:hypothetical protein
MAVLVEAISFIVRHDAIVSRFKGGWDAFKYLVPKDTLCTDGELARVGFSSLAELDSFASLLDDNGLIFFADGKTIDYTVIYQTGGLIAPTDWLEVSKISFGENGNKVMVCWLFEGPRKTDEINLPSSSMTLATPVGWTYEGSLSANINFVGNNELDKNLMFLREEASASVYLDFATGKEIITQKS